MAMTYKQFLDAKLKEKQEQARKKYLDDLQKEKAKHTINTSNYIDTPAVKELQDSIYATNVSQAANAFKQQFFSQNAKKYTQAPNAKAIEEAKNREAYKAYVQKANEEERQKALERHKQQAEATIDFFNLRDGYQFGDIISGIGTGVEDWAAKAIGGTLSDGYQFGDVVLGLGSSAVDIGTNVLHGMFGWTEGVMDAGMYTIGDVAGFFGNEDFKDEMYRLGEVDVTDDIFGSFEWDLDKLSFMGEGVDALGQGAGYIIPTLIAGKYGGPVFGAAGTSALVGGMSFSSTYGSSMSEALSDGATEEEAHTYAVLNGAAEALSDTIFGNFGKAADAVKGGKGVLGVNKGLTSIDDKLAKKLADKISNKILKNTVQYAVKSGAGGLEEWLAGVGTAAAKKATYLSEEDMGKLLEDERLLDQFVLGSILSAGFQSGRYVNSIKTGRDYITGLTDIEQKVVDKEFENRISKEEADGKTLTNNEKNKIYDAVVKDMGKGNISTETIEEVLGGDSFESFMNASDDQAKLVEQEEKLREEFNTLNRMKKGDMTGEQSDRLEELRGQLDDLKQRIEESKATTEEQRAKLDSAVREMVKDSALGESYLEVDRRGEAFETDLSQYSEKQRAVVQKAIDSGILNNTNKTHDMVDFVAKLAEDKGIDFDFANNEKLKESGFALGNGITVNGVVTADGITINVQAAKSLNSVVGHEITHVLEGSELYGELQSALFEYAKTKGEYQSRLDAITELYKNVEGANVEGELTADLVGDYLFTDEAFIKNLSVNHRNVFQRLYNEIKYLCKVATAGSKEARQLEKVKKIFDKVYRDGNATKNTVTDDGVRYALESKTQPGRLDPRTVTKSDVTKLLYKVEDGAIYGDTYIPVRINTPSTLIYWAEKRRGDVIDNNPIAMSANKAYNAMNRAGETESGRTNRLSVDEVISVIESMNDPEYIVYQGSNDRYVEVVKFSTEKGDRAFAVIEIGNNKDSVYMNGYEGGLYNIFVTTYPPKAGKLKELLNSSTNQVIYDKKKDASQRTSSSTVPSVLNDASFYEDILPDSSDSVKSQYSLTEQGEMPGKYGNYGVYGNDIALQSDDIAPLTDTNSQQTDAEDIAPVIVPEAKQSVVSSDDIAPVADDKATQVPGDKTADKILTEEPAKVKKKPGLLAKFNNLFLDKGVVFEKLAKKTNNRELEAKWNSIRYAERNAQTFIGEGNENTKSLTQIRDEVEKTGKTADFYRYLYHLHNIDRMSLEDRFGYLVENKAVFGEDVTAEMSQEIAEHLEKENPEFKTLAQDVYAYNNELREMMVENGIISEETADLWARMYPHYVPIRRVGKDGNALDAAMDALNGTLVGKQKPGVNAPTKKATGGDAEIAPLFETMAMRTQQTFMAIARNRFGVELRNTLAGNVVENDVSVDDVLDSIDAQEGLLQKGEKGNSPTYTVFENGKKVTFEITEEMYDAMLPTNELLATTIKPLNAVSNFRRKVLTEYNPWFMLKNAIKDSQDVLVNSQHPAKTYATIPEAIKEITSKGKWLQEYMKNGGGQNSYFDGQTKTFESTNSAVETIKKMTGLNLISKANETIELVPRLAEYIASRKAGKSIDVAMLDAARVTTNFAAGGDATKFLNRNGATFLNASVQGFNQQVRNVSEAVTNGWKGIGVLAAKYLAAGLPVLLLNHLVWGEDDEYDELSDYVKQNYYVVGKTGDGQFIRIPKGRMVAVIQNAFEQMENAITGDDEVDLEAFANLLVNNLAPNNPAENNIFSPIMQVMSNKTWYGEDLVPTRLQDLPAAEQYDESTDSISKWLGEQIGVSPYKINYLLDQYSGVIGDTVLPMLTPEAEDGDDSFAGNMIAPLKDMFTTDSVMNNQNVSDFYDTVDKLAVNANSSKATDEDVLKYKYMSSANAELGKLYAKKREIQSSNLPEDEKYAKVRQIQQQIVDISKDSLHSYEDVHIDGAYATVGDSHYRWYVPDEDSESEPGWKKLSSKQLAQQKKVTSGLGISASEYWSKNEEYDYAYKSPGKYAVTKAVGGYNTYKAYSSKLNAIKADKDEDGKSISGSRKEKVVRYINSLDADYGEKIILYKSEYTSDDTYNYEIVDYLNSRNDISYAEMEAILKELGFSVDSDGSISW